MTCLAECNWCRRAASHHTFDFRREKQWFIGFGVYSVCVWNVEVEALALKAHAKNTYKTNVCSSFVTNRAPQHQPVTSHLFGNFKTHARGGLRGALQNACKTSVCSSCSQTVPLQHQAVCWHNVCKFQHACFNAVIVVKIMKIHRCYKCCRVRPWAQSPNVDNSNAKTLNHKPYICVFVSSETHGCGASPSGGANHTQPNC